MHTSWNSFDIGSLTAFDCEALPLSSGSACAAMPMSILDYVSLDSQSPSLQPSQAPQFSPIFIDLVNRALIRLRLKSGIVSFVE